MKKLDLQLPSDFVKRIQEVHRERGTSWLSTIPSVLEQCSQEWNIRLGRILPNLSYNFVINGESETFGQVILKAGVPKPELDAEMSALSAYNGRSSIRLFRHSGEAGLLLLEKASPGQTLVDHSIRRKDDPEAVRICARIIHDLHSDNVTHKQMASFQTLESRLPSFERFKQLVQSGRSPFELSILIRAENEYSDLISTTQESVLLHGDLHHYNILSSKRSTWLAIDPHGLIGDPALASSSEIW